MSSETSEPKPPSYKGRRSSSERATAAARGSSKKTDTRCELLLRRALWTAGFRYRKNVASLPGRPDIVFPGAKVAVFSDGDFWHGKDWEARRQKLKEGANSDYWVAQIQRNIDRDRANTERLREMGWTVLRVWESEIQQDLPAIVRRVAHLLLERGYPMPEGS